MLLSMIQSGVNSFCRVRVDSASRFWFRHSNRFFRGGITLIGISFSSEKRTIVEELVEEM